MSFYKKKYFHNLRTFVYTLLKYSSLKSTRIYVLQTVVFFSILLLFVKLFWLQGIQSDTFARKGYSNYLHFQPIASYRGDILDTNHNILVSTSYNFNVSISIDYIIKYQSKHKHDSFLYSKDVQNIALLLNKNINDIRNMLKICGITVKVHKEHCVAKYSYQNITLLKNASPEIVFSILQNSSKYNYLNIEPSYHRVYPMSNKLHASNILGYLGDYKDTKKNNYKLYDLSNDLYYRQAGLQGGVNGIEKEYDKALRGKLGNDQIFLDNRGITFKHKIETESKPGNSLVSTIDANLQSVAEQELQNGINKARSTIDRITGKPYVADSGAMVIMDPNNGEIKAMASYPNYDLSIMSSRDSKRISQLFTDRSSPTLDRAYQSAYYPASTFKVISLLSMAKRGYNLNANYDCPSSFTVGSRVYTNMESQGYGSISLKRGVEVSCDTIFYKSASDMWKKEGASIPTTTPDNSIQDIASQFMVGKATGIDLPNESNGELSTRESKLNKWNEKHNQWCNNASTGYSELFKKSPDTAKYLREIDKENCQDGHKFREGDAINESIGQAGIMVSPLKLASIYATIANGGTIWQPHVVKQIIDDNGNIVKDIQPHVMGHVNMDHNYLSFIHSALVGVSKEGTSSPVFANSPIDIASKTGTAEVIGKQTQGWLASYAPANTPKYVIVMTVSQGGTGVGSSAQSVYNVYKNIFNIT